MLGTHTFCIAQDNGKTPRPMNIVSPASNPDDPSKAGDIVLLIQQANISPESKHVDVVNENGSTIIRGTVATDRDRQIIGGLAEKCGYANIKNELKVKQSGKKLSSPNRTIKVR